MAAKTLRDLIETGLPLETLIPLTVNVKCEVCHQTIGKERVVVRHIFDEYLGDRDRETLLAATVVCSLSCAEAWANRRAAAEGKE